MMAFGRKVKKCKTCKGTGITGNPRVGFRTCVVCSGKGWNL